jgi:hypothetical protein
MSLQITKVGTAHSEKNMPARRAKQAKVSCAGAKVFGRGEHLSAKAGRNGSNAVTLHLSRSDGADLCAEEGQTRVCKF